MKIFIRTLFATIFLLIGVDAKRKVFMTRNITVEANPSYINESFATSPCEVNTRKNPCPNVPAIYLYVVKQIRDPMLEIETRDITTDSIIVQQVLNVCSMTRNPGLNIFVRTIYDILKENINFSFKCPFKKGIYASSSFPTSPTYDILVNFFTINRPISVDITFKHRKNKTGKQMERIVSVISIVEIVEI